MFKKAERKRAKLRLAIEGPSGSGKTYSAILIARGLVGQDGKIAVLDTENESASLYAHLTDYDTAPLAAPYEPERFIKAIKAAEQAGYDCLVIDSISHEWSGKGGCLEIHGAMTGNSFTNWGRVTPRHDAFMQAMLHSPMHIIATMRSKEVYSQDKDNQGKTRVEKAGEAPQQRQGVAYEFTTVLTMNVKHVAESTKDRTGLFPADYTFTPTAETGRALGDWLNSGKEIVSSLDEDGMNKAFNAASSMVDLDAQAKSYAVPKDDPKRHVFETAYLARKHEITEAA